MLRRKLRFTPPIKLVPKPSAPFSQKTVLRVICEITNISIKNEKRVAEIVFSEFAPVYNNKLIDTKTNKNPLITLENGRILQLPRKITLVTPNFTMKIYHENDIIINI